MPIETRKCVYVLRKDHANMESLPFRFGLHFKKDTMLELFDAADQRPDRREADRFHVNASFRDPDSPKAPVRRGHFVLLEGGNALPQVVTVWRTDDAETETYLSELIRNLRRDGLVSVDDLLKLHPEHVSGGLRTAAQLFERLLGDRTEAVRTRLEAALKCADANARKLLDEVAAANRAAEAAKGQARQEADARERAEKAQQEAEQMAYTQIQKVNDLEIAVGKLEQELDDERRRAGDEQSSVVVAEPDTLIAVNEKVLHRSSSCTELVMGNGSRLHMKTLSFDRSGRVTAKAKSLVGHRVRTTCWDPYNDPGKWSSQGYFRNVYPVAD